jgi:hypothetical protein
MGGPRVGCVLATSCAHRAQAPRCFSNSWARCSSQCTSRHNWLPRKNHRQFFQVLLPCRRTEFVFAIYLLPDINCGSCSLRSHVRKGELTWLHGLCGLCPHSLDKMFGQRTLLVCWQRRLAYRGLSGVPPMLMTIAFVDISSGHCGSYNPNSIHHPTTSRRS